MTSVSGDITIDPTAIEMPTETVFAAPKTELINGKPAEAKLGTPDVRDPTAASRESSLNTLIWRKKCRA